MDAGFDFSHIAVPFRMNPGLRRVPASAVQLTRLSPGSQLHREKSLVVDAGQSVHAVPGFDTGPALRTIYAHAPYEGPLELAFEEDFAVLDGRGGTLPWLCICVPSHWAPEEKLGLSLAEVHGPVADAAMLQAASRHLVHLATSGACWERFVWTLTPSARYDQHPRRHAREPWPLHLDDEAFAARCYFRAERQAFLPVHQDTRQAVFTIRVTVRPLVEAVDTADKARRLHDSLASMTDAVLAYKNLAAAREPLLRWLATRST